jgi:phospholipase/carboxylesterase
MFWTNLFDHQWIPASTGTPFSKQKVRIVLHGRGDSLEAYQAIKQELRLPQFNYLLLNAPRKYLKGFTWQSKSARRKLNKLVRELEDLGWEPKDIFWMGHSEGAMTVADLVLHHKKAFGGVIGVSGYVRFFKGWRARKSGAKQTPWLFTHGTRDRIISPAEIREDIERLSTNEMPILYREFAKGHDFDYKNEVPFIRKWIRHARLRRMSFGGLEPAT